MPNILPGDPVEVQKTISYPYRKVLILSRDSIMMHVFANTPTYMTTEV